MILYYIDLLSQVMIVILGIITAYLFSSKNDNYRRISYLTGGTSALFWIYTSIINYQCGVFILSLYYLYCNLRGIYYYWYKPYIERKK